MKCYDKASNRLELQNHFNGAVSTYLPDALNRLTKVEHNSQENFVGRFDYGYNQINQRKWVKRNQQKGDIYGYDKIGQVTSISYNTPDINNPNLFEKAEVLNYDPVGNRQIQAMVSNQINSQISYTPNNLNQYSVINQKVLSYDYNGNLTADNVGKTYTYDSQNRLISATSPNATAQFFYDAQNRVVKRTINGVATYFVWDQWNLLEERSGSGDLMYRYVHGPRVDELISRTDANQNIIFYHHDALGNVTQLTNQKGQLVEKYEYDVFGNPIIFDANNSKLKVSAFDNRFLFTGREYLSQLGLYDYRNRIYSPVLGRFLQTDPIRFSAGDINIYCYVGNNSVNWTDSSGLLPGASNEQYRKVASSGYGSFGNHYTPPTAAQKYNEVRNDLIESGKNLGAATLGTGAAVAAVVYGPAIITAALVNPEVAVGALSAASNLLPDSPPYPSDFTDKYDVVSSAIINAIEELMKKEDKEDPANSDKNDKPRDNDEDKDGDGVPDKKDQFPEDPDRC